MTPVWREGAKGARRGIFSQGAERGNQEKERERESEKGEQGEDDIYKTQGRKRSAIVWTAVSVKMRCDVTFGDDANT